jgi:hypothetical protein
MPAGAMLDTLQGLNRDTGVGVAEFEMGVHESPFVCADHNQPPRRFITEFLDQERYGAVFEKFIERTVAHFDVPTDSGNTTAWRTRKTEDDNAVAAMN